MTYNLYWGDLHSHCSISYGHGSVEQALARARQQLDFASITGHAFWPDMPTDREVYADIIDYHTEGFARLGRNWQRLLDLQEAASVPGEFLALPSYEWHSLKYGDHNVYSKGPGLPLVDADDLPGLREVARRNDALIIPHHIGYAAGYRGIDWSHFDSARSPFVEIFSLHGCSESDSAPYPMLHDMGPRDFGSTAEAGWQLGHRFGVIGSTDHHSAYPGSHGDGRIGVYAKELTREAIWEALLARRVFAATGDKIEVDMTINDAPLGSELHSPFQCDIAVYVRGCDELDRVEVLRNGRIVQRWRPTGLDGSPNRYRVRVTWGWGRKENPVEWSAKLRIDDGDIRRVETCFSGPPVVAPIVQTGDDEIPDEVDLPHDLVELGQRECVWRSRTVGNLSMRHSTTQALSLEIDAPLATTIELEVNGLCYRHSIRELLYSARSHYLRGWLSEAVRIGPAVPHSACGGSWEWRAEPEQAVDMYRVRVAQKNGQWAWTSPIWVCWEDTS